MSNSVVIKSFHNGIQVFLDDTRPFDELMSELSEKFKESEKFFHGTRLALALEGRELNLDEEKQIIHTISSAASLNIICLVGKDEQVDRIFGDSLIRLEPRQEPKKNEVLFYRGNLLPGDTMEAEKNAIILGNVEKGARIYAGRDIIVIGALYGDATAGTDGTEGHLIAALDLQPEKLKIGVCKYIKEEKGIWAKRSKSGARIASVVEDKIVLEPVTKDLLNELNQNII